MKIDIDDIINKHKNKASVVALHGPSLDMYRDKIETLQRDEKIIRFSVNEWYDHFSEKPDYWVISNGEFTIDASIRGSMIWDTREYPRDVFNKYNIPLLYNSTADLTDPDFIDEHLKCDYLPYDTRHFKGHTCLDILKNFKSHYENNKNLNFRDYGNNTRMWDFPDVGGLPEIMKQLYGRVGGGWDIRGKCCNLAVKPTLQEKVQQYVGHQQHMGTGQTVGLFAVMFALLMGCNPIYVVGLDLDCTKGHAKGSNPKATYNSGHMGHWKKVFRQFLIDDMRILRESAELVGTKIINLNKDSWHNEFFKGEIEL